MLSKVSWGTFTEVIVILLVLYYLFIGAGYYREEIKALLSGKLLKKNKTAGKQKPQNTFKETDPAFDELETIVQDLRYAVFEKAGRQAGKQELLNRLKERLVAYSGLQKPAYRAAINNFIITNAKEMNGVAFSEHELNSAWDRQG